VTVEQVQDVLVPVDPIIGAPRVLAGAQNITDALGIVGAINAAASRHVIDADVRSVSVSG
jgi:hypothetical protein